MDYSKILNKEQLEAVTTTEGPVMVSAGAGSGKTRVLTYRVAYLITECKVAPYNILAITFTNKAANEMKERITRLDENGYMVTVSTFHSLCAKLLRMYISYVPGYETNFSIYTDQEQKDVYKLVFANLGFTKDDEKLKSEIKHHISSVKTMGMNIDEYCAIHQYSKDIKYVKRVYEDYQAELKKNNAMDFDDLLINFYQLIKNNEIVRESIQNQYRYIHIDEFQDTNSLQYEIVKLLAEKYRNIMIVGDEDQSIYSWRGANIDNIFKFTKDFPECKVIKLEQNYRSTKAVLDKANQLIKNNKNRLDKQLYTQNQQGGEVEFYSGYEESDETDYVIRHIIQAHAQGVPYNEIAILMRVNALTRSFEEKLLAYNIPHKIYNGFKFYDRLEIKNSLAYLISIANPNDNNNLMRLINFPKRSIGDASVEAMMKVADARKCSLKEVVLNSRNLDLKSSLKSKLEPLANLLKDIDEKSKTLSLYELMSYILEESKILDSFDKKNDEDYERFLNVNSLLNSIKEFEQANPDATFVEYLQMVSLTAQIDENNTQEGVVLATVHGVKGLEFNTVFIVGLEEKIFPITRDYEDSLEEERRLMYVAITRAKEKLYITNAKSRFMYGKREGSVPSRFLREIDMIKDRSFDYISPYGEYSNSYERKTTSYYNKEDNSYNDNSSYSNNYSYYKPNKTKFNSTNNTLKPNKINLGNIKGLSKGFQKTSYDKEKVKIGAKVCHPKFGTGVIVDMKDFNSNGCVVIDFEIFGKKSLSLDYAPITFVNE